MDAQLEPFKILHVTPTFYPATYYGGPILSTYALCNALVEKPGIELRILTTDAAGPKLSQRLDIRSFPTHYSAGYPVFFARRILGQEIAPGMLVRLWSMIEWADVVHLTGTYSFPTIPTLVLARLRRRPVLWSPRGALLASHVWDGASRRGVKRAWEKICQAAMPDRTLLHVTSNDEKAASLARLPGSRAVVIPNGIEVPPVAASRQWQPGGILRLMFLGRLDPVKGIANLVEAIKLAGRQPLRLDLYGTGDAQYVSELKGLVASRGLDGVIQLRGHLEGAEKGRAFAEADVCILPSFSENFGMVVAEALAHGVPVIVSRGMPWSEVEQRQCGRWVDNSPASLVDAIASMPHRDLAAMGAAGRRWMEADFGWSGIADRALQAMLALCGRAPFARPAAPASNTKVAP